MKKIIGLLIVSCGLMFSAGYNYELYVQGKSVMKGQVCVGYDLVSKNSSTTYNMTGSVSDVVFYNAQTIPTLGIVFPANPEDGQMANISSVSTINALTLKVGRSTDSIATYTTTLSAGSAIKYIYSKLRLTWYKR